MNTVIKKLTLYSIAFFVLTNTPLVYTKEEKEDNKKKSSQIISTEQEELTAQNITPEQQAEYEKQVWAFIEESFLIVTDQGQKAEYCLQQIELILQSGRYNFNNRKVSKNQLLEQIKGIKEISQGFSEYCTKELPKNIAIIQKTFFNTVFINYLLPIVKKDIALLDADKCHDYISENYTKLAEQSEKMEEAAFFNALQEMIEVNETNVTLLMSACENIGLSMVNKIYRFLDTAKVPLYGKSTIATMQDLAFWGTAAFAAYCTALYLTPKDLSIPFSNWKVIHLPLKDESGSFGLGDRKTVSDKQQKGTTSDEWLGWFGEADAAVTGSATPMITGIIGSLAYYTKKDLQAGYEKVTKNFQQSIDYYFKGNASALKDSNYVPKTYFKDMIGSQHLEQLAKELTDYLKNPTRYERAGIAPSNGYLLVGPSQTGKSFFAKALKTMVDEAFEENGQEVKFLNITSDHVKKFGFNEIFNYARQVAPVIIFMDELDMFGVRRALNATATQDLLTCMNGIDTDPTKRVIVIAATNKPEELDFALLQKGRLGTIISFDYPNYENRKHYLEKQLNKKNIFLVQDMIETIAQETKNHTYNMIDDIIRNALQLATYETRPVKESDFEMTLDREIRKIKPNTTMSAQEKELVAIYQAGQAAARHILSTDQQVVKITIDTVYKAIHANEGWSFTSDKKGEKNENNDLLPKTPAKQTRFGYVFTISKTNNSELLSDDDKNKEMLALLSGQAALELIQGKTFNDFGKEDRAKILQILESRIAQGNPITNAIRQQAIAEKDALYFQAKNILKNHTQFINTIVDVLLQHHSIDKAQWAQLQASYPIA